MINHRIDIESYNIGYVNAIQAVLEQFESIKYIEDVKKLYESINSYLVESPYSEHQKEHLRKMRQHYENGSIEQITNDYGNKYTPSEKIKLAKKHAAKFTKIMNPYKQKTNN